MAWDASTDASLAALLVAFVALFVTSAQALQQYLVSGQLIRICDSVVYGKMPGQGRRIWQFSQFRFRIVYSIPQIRLPSSLWSDIPSHSSPDEEGDLILPDLQPSIGQSKLGLKQFIKNQFDKQTRRSQDHICGEASWVSFCRAIQHSSGSSLQYEMIDGDADRCPTDLPAVPMQLSMRDVITVAMMTGMECTDISYQKQSLSMQGRAGTITSSRHPILGAVIHFAPKFLHEKHGLRANGGTVNPQWMARMRDIITIACQEYNIRDRKHFEEDEGNWTMLSDDRSIVKYQEKSTQDSQPGNSKLRRRRGTQGNPVLQSEELVSTDYLEHSTAEVATHKLNQPTDLSMRRPQDGNWSWSFSSEKPEAEKASASHEAEYSSPSSTNRPQALPFRDWYYQLTAFLRRRLSATIDLPRYNKKPSVLPVSEPIESSRQMNRLETKAVSKQSRTGIDNLSTSFTTPAMTRGNHSNPTEDGLGVIRDHRELGLRVVNDETRQNSPSAPRRLLLMNKEAAKSRSSSIQNSDDRCTKSEKELAAARGEQFRRKWQSIVKNRQDTRAAKLTEEQDLLRRKSDLRQRDEILEHRTASNPELQLRIAESGFARKSDDDQSGFKTSPSSPSRLRSGSRRKYFTSSSRNIGTRNHIPPRAKWTKIDRKLVNPQALKDADETFACRPDYVIVGRVLTREEIEIYALRTQEIREARRAPKSRFSASEFHVSSSISSNAEDSDQSFERLPPEAPCKEASPTKDGNTVAANQLPNEEGSNSLPLKDESEVQGLHQSLAENLSAEARLKGLDKTRNSEHRDSIPIDKINHQRALSSINLDHDHGVSQIEKELPKTEGPEKELPKETSQQYTASPFSKLEQDYQNAQIPSNFHDKRHNKSRARRPSSVHTESSNSIQKELLQISFNSLLEKLSKKIRQCDDIPVALNHFLNSQTNPRYSTDRQIAVDDQLKNTRITMLEILRIANQTHEQMDLNNSIVLDLEIFVANIGKCLDALDSDFELFDITHMDIKKQQKTWDEMLRNFKKRNSSSLVDHLQITHSFGKALLSNLGAETSSSPESNELREILLEINGQPRSRSPNLSDSDVYTTSELEKPYFKPRGGRGVWHENSTQKQDVSGSTPTEEEQPSPTGAVNWLWICQADIIPGYFATPWKGMFSEATCIGAISTVLHGLNAVNDSPTCRYVEKQQRYQDWIYAGNVTYPSYALNAQGGVVVSGVYRSVPFAGFPGHLPHIELLHSYDHQVRRGVCHIRQKPSAVVDDLAELMGLDTWLSLCGRTPPIYDGPSNLLRTLPALAQCILSDFEFEFANLDRTTSNDGRFPLIQIVAESLTAALTQQNLSEPERLFAMVGFLRAAKTALCVVRGSDTTKLRDVLENDIQVYLA